MNPTKHSVDDVNPTNGLGAKTIWEHDSRKLEFAKSRGFDVMVVWESDVIADREGIIQKCIDFMEN